MSLLKSIENSAGKVGLEVEQGLSFLLHLVSALAPYAAVAGTLAGAPEVVAASKVAEVAAGEGTVLLNAVEAKNTTGAVNSAVGLTGTIASATGDKDIAANIAKLQDGK